MLLKVGLTEDEAYTLVQEGQTMASANIITSFQATVESLKASMDAKMDVLNGRMDAIGARIDAQIAAMTNILWTLGIGLTGLALLITVFGILPAL